jgi:hypothetical protein
MAADRYECPGYIFDPNISDNRRQAFVLRCLLSEFYASYGDGSLVIAPGARRRVVTAITGLLRAVSLELACFDASFEPDEPEDGEQNMEVRASASAGAVDVDIPTHEARENAFQALCDYRRALGDHPDSVKVQSSIEMIKAQRPAESIARLDAERLARTRAE